MDPGQAKFMRTERKPGSVDVHPNIDAIVLSYEIDVQILDFKENVIHAEKKSLKKVIELPMINSRTDCHILSKEIINHCDLIHHSRLAELEQIIYYLKKRRLHISGKDKKQVQSKALANFQLDSSSKETHLMRPPTSKQAVVRWENYRLEKLKLSIVLKY